MLIELGDLELLEARQSALHGLECDLWDNLWQTSSSLAETLTGTQSRNIPEGLGSFSTSKPSREEHSSRPKGCCGVLHYHSIVEQMQTTTYP